MRPDSVHDPTIETAEELSDVSPLVVVAPTPQNRIQFLDQLLGRQRHAPLGKLPYLIHEVSDRFLTGIGIQRSRSDTTTYLARGQAKLLLTALDLVSQKLESLPDMHDPRLLRMQLHAQLTQNPKSSSHRRSRLRHGCTRHHPIIRKPCESIPLASHLLIKWRQKNVTEQGRNHPALRSPALARK